MGRNREQAPKQGKLEEALTSLLTEVRERDRAMSKVVQEAADLEGRLDLATMEVARLERRAEDHEHLRRQLPDGVTRLRDGSYETDEKIRLFAREIQLRTLPELEAMFAMFAMFAK